MDAGIEEVVCVCIQRSTTVLSRERVWSATCMVCHSMSEDKSGEQVAGGVGLIFDTNVKVFKS